MDERVRLMSLQERGAYITLLCMCWQEGSLPANVEDIARLVGVRPQYFKRLWSGQLGSCFFASVEDGGRWRHKRLDQEREKQEHHRQRASDKGRIGAQNRWHRHRAGNAQAMPSDGSAVSDLRTAVIPPVVPHGGLTKKERREAERIRNLELGCRHSPRCSTMEECVMAIARELRHKRAAS